MSAPVISVYLGDLRSKWENYCLSKGVKSSSALRQIVQHLLSKEQTKAVIADVVDDGKTIRVEIRLRASQLSELKIRSVATGFNHNKYICSLIQTHLIKSPVFGQHELDAITASTTQLVRIGTNLNQVARAINRNPLETDLVRVELLEELSKLINHHIQQVATLVESNLQRWQGGKHG